MCENIPDLYKAIVADGHQVGNHSHNHISGLRLTFHEYSYNVEHANAYIHSHLFRPPHGWMRIIQYYLIMRRYKVVMWGFGNPRLFKVDNRRRCLCQCPPLRS